MVRVYRVPHLRMVSCVGRCAQWADHCPMIVIVRVEVILRRRHRRDGDLYGLMTFLSSVVGSEARLLPYVADIHR